MIEIEVSHSGSVTEDWLRKIARGDFWADLNRYGQDGVLALMNATPKHTGLTAISWNYRILRDRRGLSIEWFNDNAPEGTDVAILIQYGHATRNGGYVNGIDYINPAMTPLFDRIVSEIWGKVTNG